MYLATYNIRTLRTQDRLYELEKEVLERINWHIIGLCETRRRGEEMLKLNSGHLLYCKGNDERSDGGVGMVIHKSMSEKLMNIKAISNRVIYATFRINKRYELKIVQAYAPTSSSTDEDIDQFYEDLDLATRENRCFDTVVMGDFQNWKKGGMREICRGVRARTEKHAETVNGRLPRIPRPTRNEHLLQEKTTTAMDLAKPRWTDLLIQRNTM